MNSNCNNLLRTAILETLDEHYERSVKTEQKKPHRFSLDYRIKRGRVIERFAKPLPNGRRKIARRIGAVFAAAALSVIIISGFSSYRLVNGFKFYNRMGYYALSVDSFDDNARSAIDEKYHLTDPSLDECSVWCDSKSRFILTYKYNVGDNETEISFCQIPALKTDSMEILPEDTDLKEISVNGNPGFYTICDNKAHYGEDSIFEYDVRLYWYMDGYFFYISCAPCLTTALSFAESAETADAGLFGS